MLDLPIETGSAVCGDGWGINVLFVSLFSLIVTFVMSPILWFLCFLLQHALQVGTLQSMHQYLAFIFLCFIVWQNWPPSGNKSTISWRLVSLRFLWVILQLTHKYLSHVLQCTVASWFSRHSLQETVLVDALAIWNAIWYMWESGGCIYYR